MPKAAAAAPLPAKMNQPRLAGARKFQSGFAKAAAQVITCSWES